MSHPTWSRRRAIKAAVATGLALPGILRVRAALAAYPDRPVRFVVANTPGGPSDITARIVTAALEQSTGKTFVVENRGGAGGNIGMGYAASAEPDGYTILLATNAYSVNYGLYHKLPYDPYKDFVGVCELASSPNTFVVRSELPAKTPPEAVKWLEAETLKILGTPEMKEKLLKAGFLVRPKGGDAAWARVMKEIDLYKSVIEQSGMQKL